MRALCRVPVAAVCQRAPFDRLYTRRVRRARLAVVVVAASCGRVDFDPPPDAADACAAERMELGRWSTPTLLIALDSTVSEDDPTPSDDELELYFTSTRMGSLGKADMWRVRRASLRVAWGPVEHVDELSTAQNENTPELSSDGLTMWFASDRPGGMGQDDLWVTTRPDRSSPWTAPRNVRELNTPGIERGPSIFLGGLAMIFHSDRPGGKGGTDFWITMRSSLSETATWSTPVPLASANTPGNELRGWMSPCGLELYYQADRGSGMDFYKVRRSSFDEPFGPEQPIPELNDPAYDQDLRLSPDRRHAVFSSQRSGAGDLYESFR
jgi:Tol biopolymer transport system component